jgi:hypothetical protein
MRTPCLQTAAGANPLEHSHSAQVCAYSGQQLAASAGLYSGHSLVAGGGLAHHGGAGALGGQGGAASSLGLEGADVQGGGVLALAVCLPGVLWTGQDNGSSRSAHCDSLWRQNVCCSRCKQTTSRLSRDAAVRDMQCSTAAKPVPAVVCRQIQMLQVTPAMVLHATHTCAIHHNEQKAGCRNNKHEQPGDW